MCCWGLDMFLGKSEDRIESVFVCNFVLFA